ncbi:MAG: hypothetical protein KAR42_07200 [candidate division Zixibacteria bacterium]|nr:hypothetical protein [candidate division Zixibacteria bacterium]
MSIKAFSKKTIYRHLVAKYINDLKVDIDPRKKTIIALNHFYDQDLRALQKANTEYNIVIIDAPRLVRGAKLYYSDPVIALTAPYTDEPKSNRKNWNRECEYIFNLLEKKFSCDLIITGSDVFWWVRELIHVAREHDTKTIVLDKEGIRTPYAFIQEAKRIKDFTPFISDHIFVWSERQKRFWKNAGAADTDITIVGQPRSDLFFSEKRTEVDEFFPHPQPLVCLFSYHDDAYVPPKMARDEGINWRKMKRESHDCFSQLAAENPGYNFVIKTHPQQSDLEILKSDYNMENLKVIGGASVANELIQRSELIIAFQTTSIIEALMLGKKIIYTAWDPNYDNLLPHLIPLHNAGGMVIAKSLEQFKEVCQNYFTGDELLFDFSDIEVSRRKDFVGEYLFQPDGLVSTRFFKEISQYLR